MVEDGARDDPQASLFRAASLPSGLKRQAADAPLLSRRWFCLLLMLEMKSARSRTAWSRHVITAISRASRRSPVRIATARAAVAVAPAALCDSYARHDDENRYQCAAQLRVQVTHACSPSPTLVKRRRHANPLSARRPRVQCVIRSSLQLRSQLSVMHM
jgi:hypothetical protein